MKTFDSVLEENNIWSPRTRLGKMLDEKYWANVREMYENLDRCYLDLIDRWEFLKKDLEKHWQKKFPVVVPQPKLVFSNRAEAAQAIADATKQLLDINLMTHYSEFDHAERKQWIDELVAAASEDCDLLVIKGNYSPYDYNKEQFNSYVKEHKPTSILISCIAPIWVAFNPHKDYDTSDWCMHKNSSTVEYI